MGMRLPTSGFISFCVHRTPAVACLLKKTPACLIAVFTKKEDQMINQCFSG